MLYEANYGADLRPTLIAEGYAARRFAYDPVSGIATRVEYLDGEDRPVLLSTGYASYELQYDSAGNLLRRAYYDETGHPVVPNTASYAWFERSLDEHGRVLEEAYYDADGSLLVNPDGYAVQRMAYDDAAGMAPRVPQLFPMCIANTHRRLQKYKEK